MELAADLFAHFAHAIVQCGYVALGRQIFVDKPDPILLRGAVRAVARGETAVGRAEYFEEQITVEEPFGAAAVGGVGGDVCREMLFVPVDRAVVAAVVYEHQVADLGALDFRASAGRARGDGEQDGRFDDGSDVFHVVGVLIGI